MSRVGASRRPVHASMASNDTPRRSYHRNKWYMSASNESGPPSSPGLLTTPQNRVATSSNMNQDLLSSQPRLRSIQRSEWEKADIILGTISKDFNSLGNFLKTLFHNRTRGSIDPRSPRHQSMVTAFLEGESSVKMGDIIDLIYHHHQSQPRLHSKHAEERELAFSPISSPSTIKHARPSLSTWAVQLIGNTVYREVGKLTKDDPTDPEDRTQLRASTNGRAKNVRVITWEDLGKFSIATLAEKYKKRAPLVWYLTESMAGTRKNGIIVVRERRPHTTVSSIVYKQCQDLKLTMSYHCTIRWWLDPLAAV